MAHERIARATFSEACRAGDVAAMRALLIGLWPFVERFPRMVRSGSVRALLPGLLREHGMADTSWLLLRSLMLLRSIAKDEHAHRFLWLETGAALGISYPADFAAPTLTGVRQWMQALEDRSDRFSLLMRIVAIEIIAESVSREFLASKRFCAILGDRGLAWFYAHIPSKDGHEMSHEELALRLGFTLCDAPSREQCGRVIESVVDLFVAAADACLRRAPR